MSFYLDKRDMPTYVQPLVSLRAGENAKLFENTLKQVSSVVYIVEGFRVYTGELDRAQSIENGIEFSFYEGLNEKPVLYSFDDDVWTRWIVLPESKLDDSELSNWIRGIQHGFDCDCEECCEVMEEAANA